MQPFDPNALLDAFVTKDGSNLYLSVGAPPTMRTGEGLAALTTTPLTEDSIRQLMAVLVDANAISQFESFKEYNTAVNWNNRARFRINMFRQRQNTAAVVRRIRTNIPTLENLSLPPIYGSLIMERRGLVLLAGSTGSGKSTSLAAMLEHRNHHGNGHILTIEDPIEFMLDHKKCIINQRDLGIDTASFGIALKNALRQQPDVIVIGEIRDRDTMEHALTFSETGHLCLATVHANNANQTIERILNFFPEEQHRHALANLSLNLKAILSQRLIRNVHGKNIIALEVMLNQGLIRSLIENGKVGELKAQIEKNYDNGMCSFDQSLYDLFKRGLITQEIALEEADNPANLRVRITQHNVNSKTL